MKKVLFSTAFSILLLVISVSASANSWGLTGDLLEAVMAVSTWNDYHTLSNQSGPFAVMQSRYHQALFYADDMGELHVYTTAVYQPDDSRNAPVLSWDGRFLTISYGNDESYTFCEWEEGSAELQLSEAAVNGFHLTGIPDESGYSWKYKATDDSSEEALVLPERILLSSFDIRLFPRSLAEVRHLNYMHARFDSGMNVLGTASGTGDPYDPDHPGEPMQAQNEGTAAVYSAPYGKSAWRSGKGKAAVGLKGTLWLLRWYLNEEGQSYACIRYNVSERTQRIGYVSCTDLGLPDITDQSSDPGQSFVHIDVEAASDTFMTDDPDVSQFPQFTVPKGTVFSCLGLYNDSYAYVAAEVKDDHFVDGGSIIWGFVPVRDLMLMEQAHRTDVMEQIAGDWIMDAGGTLAPDILHLQANGTFTAGSGIMSEGEDVVIEGAQSGSWYITDYNPFMNLYWDQTPYEITLLFDNGSATVLGLDIGSDEFSLIFREGGAGYVPYDGPSESEVNHG